MKRTKSYQIPMSPVFYKTSYRDRFVEYEYQGKKERMICYIEQQHNNAPIFTKPVGIQANFYIGIPKPLYRRSRSIWHDRFPDEEKLTRLLLEILKGRVICNEYIVASVTSNKQFDKEPRIEFTITEL